MIRADTTMRKPTLNIRAYHLAVSRILVRVHGLRAEFVERLCEKAHSDINAMLRNGLSPASIADWINRNRRAIKRR